MAETNIPLNPSESDPHIDLNVITILQLSFDFNNKTASHVYPDGTKVEMTSRANDSTTSPETGFTISDGDLVTTVIGSKITKGGTVTIATGTGDILYSDTIQVGFARIPESHRKLFDEVRAGIELEKLTDKSNQQRTGRNK